jgi:MFS family permease
MALSAAVADLAPAESRRRAFGYVYWAVNLGMSCAAVLGGVMSKRGYGLLFVGDAATTVVFALLVLALFPETRPPAIPGRAHATLAAQAHVVASRSMRGFLVAQTLVTFVLLQAFVTLPLQERAIGLSVESVGLVAAVNGVVIVLAQPLFLRVSRGASNWSVLTLSAAVMAAGCWFMSGAGTLGTLIAGMIALSTAEVAFSSAAPAYAAHVAPVDQRGMYQAAYGLTWSAANLVAPVLGTGARDVFGSRAMWLSCAGLCVLATVVHAAATRRAERLTRSSP